MCRSIPRQGIPSWGNSVEVAPTSCWTVESVSVRFAARLGFPLCIWSIYKGAMPVTSTSLLVVKHPCTLVCLDKALPCLKRMDPEVNCPSYNEDSLLACLGHKPLNGRAINLPRPLINARACNMPGFSTYPIMSVGATTVVSGYVDRTQPLRLA